jgi:hypothetical protein
VRCAAEGGAGAADTHAEDQARVRTRNNTQKPHKPPNKVTMPGDGAGAVRSGLTAHMPTTRRRCAQEAGRRGRANPRKRHWQGQGQGQEQVRS